MFIAGRHVPFVSITNYTEGGKGEGESPLVYLAPEGRHVYSRATYKYLKAPEGRHVYSWATCKYLKAPEGRHVYSRATCKCLKAPEGRHVYSTRHTPNTPKPQRGDMCPLSESQITRIKGLHGLKTETPPNRD